MSPPTLAESAMANAPPPPPEMDEDDVALAVFTKIVAANLAVSLSSSQAHARPTSQDGHLDLERIHGLSQASARAQALPLAESANATCSSVPEADTTQHTTLAESAHILPPPVPEADTKQHTTLAESANVLPPPVPEADTTRIAVAVLTPAAVVRC